MRKEIHIDVGAITNNIFAGYVSKDGKSWLESGRTVVTGKACAAVAQYVLAKGGLIDVTENGKPKWEILVREVAGSNDAAMAGGGERGGA